MVNTSTPQWSDSSMEFTFAAPPPAVTALDTHRNYVGPSSSSLKNAETNPATGLFDSYLNHVSSLSSPGSPPVTTYAVVPLRISSDGYPKYSPKVPLPHGTIPREVKPIRPQVPQIFKVFVMVTHLVRLHSPVLLESIQRRLPK